jgi:hypothetical protein
MVILYLTNVMDVVAFVSMVTTTCSACVFALPILLTNQTSELQN